MAATTAAYGGYRARRFHPKGARRLHCQPAGERAAAVVFAGMTDQDQIGRKLRGGFEQAVHYIAVEHQTSGAARTEVCRNIPGQPLQGLGMGGGLRLKLRPGRPAQDMDEAEFRVAQDAR